MAFQSPEKIEYLKGLSSGGNFVSLDDEYVVELINQELEKIRWNIPWKISSIVKIFIDWMLWWVTQK